MEPSKLKQYEAALNSEETIIYSGIHDQNAFKFLRRKINSLQR